MQAPLILGIDQGTHATRAIVFDRQGTQLAQAQQAVDLQVVSADRVEQDAGQILASVRTVMRRVLADPALAGATPAVAGLATQRSSVVAWRRSDGMPLAPLLSWQDRRSADFISAFTDCGPDIARRTGLRLSPHYGAGKLRWLLDHEPAVARARAEHDLLLGPLAAFLVYNLLTGRPARVDHANAARTLLWNLDSRDWDPVLLERFAIPRSVLPETRPIVADYGRLDDSGIPLRLVNGDQTAALYAQGSPANDTLYVNIGTGAFVLLPVDRPGDRPAGLLGGIACSDGNDARYYLEGTVNGAGAALARVQQQFGATGFEHELPRWLDTSVDPCLFINRVGGLGAPWWRADESAEFTCDTLDAAEAAVAVVESIVFLLQVNIALLQGVTASVCVIRISGGLSALDGLCQRLADLSGLPVLRPAQTEASARGAAWLAAGGREPWPAVGQTARFEPRANPSLQARYRRFVAIIETL